ncbi:uncharacterized protein C18orf63-like isoform X2 [Cyclopterus lumpus]|uniref:uncharacterized protein C18orf63-like isoform X2 n=1 Tax=Cyclopterus lumpus TaxID=8103 RepID=UPI0014867766|nr:uncharacterized protein C18orf63-like isoform X2 [Cyclopterus lumpus]
MSVFLLPLPALEKLCCVSVTLQQEEDLRSRQMKTCRELVLLYSGLLASPALDSFSDITVVVSIPFFQRGFLQVFVQGRSLQLGCPQCVSPGVLQCCLSYSLITRLAPSWNKAGLYLISGKDFLTESGRLNAVGMELSTSEGQLVLNIEANTVRLPPTRLEDFDLPPLVLRRFCSDPVSVLDPSSTGRPPWCHVLPSMKKGQIITITRQLPRDGPFRTYGDLQNHWNRLYGYRLPELAEEEVVYCSIYFRPVGQRLFTYPLSCVRLQPVQRCPRVDLQGALGSFLADIGGKLRDVCGFPARLTGKPRYCTAGLSSAAVCVLAAEQVNLSSSSPIRPVLTQLPPPPPRPVKPSLGSQPPAWSPLTQQDGAPGLLGNILTQSKGWRGGQDWPSSSSSSSSSSSRVSFSHPLVHQSALFLSSSSCSSSSLSLASASSLPPLPPPMVPIFKNKCPSRLVNVALLRLQKQREQLIGGGGGGERGRVTLPAFWTKTSASASSSSLSSQPAVLPRPVPPPLPVPRFNRRPKSLSLSPASKSRPGFLLAPETETTKPKTSSQTTVKSSSDRNPAPPPSDISNTRPPPSDISNTRPPPSDISNTRPPPSDISNTRPPPSDISNTRPPPSDISNTRPPPSDISNTRPPPSDISNTRPPPSDISNKDASSSRRRVAFETKPKKPRSAIRDVDVGQMARSNQIQLCTNSFKAVQAELGHLAVLAEGKRSSRQHQTPERGADAEGHGLSGRRLRHTHTHTLTLTHSHSHTHTHSVYLILLM